MVDHGEIRAIFVAPDSGEPMEPVEAVEAVAGRGLRGDRYFDDRGLYDRRDDLPEGTDVTLIEQEALDALARDYDVALPPVETRRNVLTEGVALNHLVDREFRVGDARFEGVRLCEPCSYMAGLADVPDGAEDAADGAAEDAADAVSGLTHRGGLNANVVETGRIAVGGSIEG